MQKKQAKIERIITFGMFFKLRVLFFLFESKSLYKYRI